MSERRNDPLSEDEILAIITNELSNSSFSSADQSYGQLEDSMSLYLGLPNGTEVPGRSQVTSTDVADSIEWIMPQVMESFTQVNEIVKFDPVGANDARQAELESQFVYDILMKENDGFIVIYEMVKDALMQRNGVLKVYYEKEECLESIELTAIDQNALSVLHSMPDIEITELSQYEDSMFGALYDVKAVKTCTKGKICVESIPLEEFRVNAQHNSISLKNARFTAHVATKTISDLIESGYDRELVENLSGFSDYRKDYRFAAMDEASINPQPADESQQLVQVHECYMLIDIERSGTTKLKKITCAGSTDTPDVILSIDDVQCMPWVSTTPIIMPHKFQGLSISDRSKEIQEQKTAVLRNIFDNLYLQNNGRYKVLEGRVNMDDLLVSRPGGAVRVKQLDAIMPIDTPQLSPVTFEVIEYLDKVRAGRTGVQADGNASPVAIGDRVGSEGVARLLNGKEALVGLIIRTIAETGIKPLMSKIRDLAIKHFDVVQDYEFRGEWSQIIPAQWVKNRSSTVKIGTGSGDKQEKLTTLNSILQYQTTAVQNPQQTLVDQTLIYNTLDDICKLAGLNSASRYFIDPGSQSGMQKQQAIQQQSMQDAQQQQQVQLAQFQLEAKVAQAQETVANAQLEAVRLKHQIETHKLKISELESQVKQYELGIETAHKDDQMQLNYDKMATDAAIKLTKIESDSQTQQNENFAQNLSNVHA